MLKKLFYNRTLVISVFVILIIGLTIVGLGPLICSMIAGPGVTTEPLDDSRAKEASTDVNGQWRVGDGTAPNLTSVGFSFNEVLPAERRLTSGSTTAVDGEIEVTDQEVTEGSIKVLMEELTTDKKVRDQNMKSKLFETDKFPEAFFKLTAPVDLSGVPEDGTKGKVTMEGELTIKDATQEIKQDFDVLRDGEHLDIGGTIPINRLDYNVKTPEFLAAKVAEEGDVNILISFEKQD